MIFIFQLGIIADWVLKRFLKLNEYRNIEAATGSVLWKKLFLKSFQYSQEDTCVGVSLLKRN